MNIKRSEHKNYSHLFDHILDDVVTAISILYLIILVAELYMAPTAVNLVTLVLLDTAICILFLFEYLYFLFKSENKSAYFKNNMFDLMASFPYLLFFSLSPLTSILNIFKVLRGLKNIVKLYEYLVKKKVNLFWQVLSLFLLVLIYFSIIIVHVERDVNSGLTTFHDGVWWAMATMTTVGYGDVSPMTYTGKIVASFLMMFGIGLSSAVGAMFVSLVLQSSQRKMINKDREISQNQKKLTETEELILKRLNAIERRMAKEDAVKSG